jgi:hypothetical protein
MGTRNVKRQIAKARLRVLGLENINTHMSETNSNGVKNLRVALSDERAHRLQTAYGRKPRRKLKRVSA